MKLKNTFRYRKAKENFKLICELNLELNLALEEKKN